MLLRYLLLTGGKRAGKDVRDMEMSIGHLFCAEQKDFTAYVLKFEITK